MVKFAPCDLLQCMHFFSSHTECCSGLTLWVSIYAPQETIPAIYVGEAILYAGQRVLDESRSKCKWRGAPFPPSSVKSK